MILDGLSQPPGAGRSIAFRPDGPFQIADATMEWGAMVDPSEDAPTGGVSGDAIDTYAGVTMRRVVLARPEYLVDIFVVEGGEERRIDWVFRNAGALAPFAENLAAGAGEVEGEGYEHLHGLQRHALGGDTALTWQLEGSGMALFMAEEAGTSLFTGRAPGNPAEERQGLVIRQRRKTRAAFLSVFHPFGEAPRIDSVAWHGRDLLGAGWAACTVEGANGRDRWIIRLRPEADIPSALAELPADNRFTYTLES